MESAIRNVAELSADERHVYENVLGQPLRDDQRIIVQLLDGGQIAPISINGPGELPDWCAIWADLSDEEIADLESAILERSDSRPTCRAVLRSHVPDLSRQIPVV